MSLFPAEIKKIKDLPKSNPRLIIDIKTKISQLLDGKREVMYSDIINYIIREQYKGDTFNKLILFCAYKIKLGEFIVVI